MTTATSVQKKLGLFVYGTLRDTHLPRNERGIQVRARMQGTIKGKIFNVRSFPGVILENDGIDIIGEIIDNLDSDRLMMFDRYEGYDVDDLPNSLYLRTTVDVRTTDGVRNCWIYVYNQPTENLFEIPSGDWFNR